MDKTLQNVSKQDLILIFYNASMRLCQGIEHNGEVLTDIDKEYIDYAVKCINKFIK